MADPLPRLTTALSDRYRIGRELGAGGIHRAWSAVGPRLLAALGCFATLLLSGYRADARGAEDTPPPVHPNDNRLPAGRLRGDTLELRLEVRMATWRPEADSGPSIEVAAFAEVGGPPQIPAPLIRVPAGTIIAASVRNALPDSTIAVHGLVTHPAARDDSLTLRPGESARLTFAAGEAGTYAYWATLGPSLHRLAKDPEHEQLAGAFVVNPPGVSPPDRILVMNVWGTPLDSSRYRRALTINGRSWPYTERIEATVGDSVRWRVVNASRRGHPMHLHGFYFRLDGVGNGLADTTLLPAQRPMVVTQSMRPFQTMALTWVPERAGNWLFHCHIGFHVVPGTRLNPPLPESHDRMAHDPAVHMAGLVMGIAVRPVPGAVEPPEARRDGSTCSSRKGAGGAGPRGR